MTADEGQRAGSVHEEAARLFEALERAAAAWGEDPGPDPAGDEAPAQDAGEAHLPTTCGVCPLCLGLARLGRSRPQVLGHLADAAAALSAAVAALAAQEDTAPPDAARPDPDPARPATERIDVTD